MRPRGSCAIPLALALLFTVPPCSPQKTQKGVPEIARDATRAAVLLVALDKAGEEIRQGSGFVISDNGKIVTNYHVIEGANSAIVKFSNGAFYLIEGVVGADPAKDIAVLKAAGKELPWLPIGNSDRVQVGEHVVAVGSPLAIEASVSDGIIGAVREIKYRQGSLTVLQTTVPISPGSSGGALLNMNGEVIGVTAAQVTGGQNLNFAIPINYVAPLLTDSLAKPLAKYATTSTDPIATAPTVPPSRDQQPPATPKYPRLDGNPHPQTGGWEIKEHNGVLLGSAEKFDAACLALARDEFKNPSGNWYNCWPAVMTKAEDRFTREFSLDVMIVPRYRDSKRVDVTVTIEQPDHTYRTYVKRDVSIESKGRILVATARFWVPNDLVSVPTVDATEKGGRKEVTHSYR